MNPTPVGLSISTIGVEVNGGSIGGVFLVSGIPIPVVGMIGTVVVMIFPSPCMGTSGGDGKSVGGSPKSGGDGGVGTRIVSTCPNGPGINGSLILGGGDRGMSSSPRPPTPESVGVIITVSPGVYPIPAEIV